MEQNEGAEPSADERLAEANRLWQSRFDRLLKEKKMVEEQLNQASAVDRESAEKEARYARRERIFNSALDRGIDPKQALDVLLGEDDEARLDGLQKTIAAGVDAGVDAEVERRFKNAPKPAGGGLTAYMPSWDQIQQMPEQELQRLGAQAIAGATKQAGAEKSSLRAKIQNRLKGGTL